MTWSPAEAAGLAIGDVIVQMDYTEVTSMSSLTMILRSHRPGDQITITYVRGDEWATITLTLAERPE
jgi:putative serine protease PepD